MGGGERGGADSPFMKRKSPKIGVARHKRRAPGNPRAPAIVMVR